MSSFILRARKLSIIICTVPAPSTPRCETREVGAHILELWGIAFYMTKHDKIRRQFRETLQKYAFLSFTIRYSSIGSFMWIRANLNTTFKRFESLPHRGPRDPCD